MVALGHLNVGLFANDDGMRDRVLAAAKAEGERMWTMPLEDDYKDYLKSAFADIANVGGRWGGAVTAAMFLKEFADDTPWVHLDIAGTAWLDDAKPYLAKGPVGSPGADPGAAGDGLVRRASQFCALRWETADLSPPSRQYELTRIFTAVADALIGA